jgi:hypothetical protein
LDELLWDWEQYNRKEVGKKRRRKVLESKRRREKTKKR